MTDEQPPARSSPMAAGDQYSGETLLTRSGWLTVGLKLLGVVFAVYGLANLASVAGMFAHVVIAETGGGTFFPVFPGVQGTNTFEWMRSLLYSSLQPLTYLLAAYVLIRKTGACARYICRDPMLD